MQNHNSKTIRKDSSSYPKNDTELLEKLAELEHIQWSSWVDYELNHLTTANILRWNEQRITPYKDLSERDKEKDRIWARKVLKVLKGT